VLHLTQQQSLQYHEHGNLSCLLCVDLVTVHSSHLSVGRALFSLPIQRYCCLIRSWCLINAVPMLKHEECFLAIPVQVPCSAMPFNDCVEAIDGGLNTQLFYSCTSPPMGLQDMTVLLRVLCPKGLPHVVMAHLKANPSKLPLQVTCKQGQCPRSSL
jgi:hypothetical protein